MATNDLKLLGRCASPYVNRVQIALNMKSINYEYLEENLGSKSSLLLNANPVNKKVPVLIHGNKSVSESLVILQYIDEVWTNGPCIIPSDPLDRAEARFWADYIDHKVWLKFFQLKNHIISRPTILVFELQFIWYIIIDHQLTMLAF